MKLTVIPTKENTMSVKESLDSSRNYRRWLVGTQLAFAAYAVYNVVTGALLAALVCVAMMHIYQNSMSISRMREKE